ncbi:MAG: UDP-2,3-diacylglucosamine diphosphatase LpxI [Hyphomicrobiaceae bacterium]
MLLAMQQAVGGAEVDANQSGMPVEGGATREPLGVLACAGPLPVELAEAGARQGRPIHIVAIEGFAGDEVAKFPHERVSIGQLGRMLASFRSAGVKEIVIAGAMQRPNLMGLRIDWGFVRHLPTVLALTRGGDDSVLRRVVRFFEGEGLTVVGASDIAPGLLAPHGVMTARQPSAEQSLAIQRGTRLIADLGRFDIGQGVIATADEIVAVEGLRGTDAMLRDLGPGEAAEGRGLGGVLVKLAKPGQEMRIDLPTIGPETVRRAAAAGLAGIAVGAGGAIVLEQARVIADADAAGLFVTGIGRASPEMPLQDGCSNGQENDEREQAQTPRGLEVVARRAPTPGERRDMAIGREVLLVLGAHGAGRAVLVSREHVLAVAGEGALAPFLKGHGRTRTWARTALGRRRGVLVVDVAATGSAGAESLLDLELFSTAKATQLAGIVVLAPLGEGERRKECIAWANEAGVFLMCRAGEPS